MENTILGDNCVVGSGTILGTDAYETIKSGQDLTLVPQIGGVEVGNNVVFLSGVMVARSCFPVMTKIGDHSSFDNMVHIAHDCLIGTNVQVTAGAILCGRVTVGDKVYVGPGAIISNGLTLGDGAFVTIGSVVIGNVGAGERVTGNFALKHKQYMSQFRAMQKQGE